jgi:prepilin-type N-terminal cleavage/methylation domain-containing protein
LLTERIRGESGYSLVEVMASITILAIAIIPMVGMFDMGLNSATTSSNYDAARAFANERLERVKVLSYAQVRDNFPTASSTPDSTGAYTTSPLAVPTSAGLPPSGSTYTVNKQYVTLLTDASSLTNSDADSGMIRVTITVNWQGNDSITVSGYQSQAAG